MVKGTRIRWVNVARLAAGAIGCVALILGLPALLKRPEPPPLPPDVGLSPAAMPPSGQLRAARSAPRRDEDARPPKQARGRQKAHVRHRGARSSHRREAALDPPPQPPSEPEPSPVAAPAPAPSPPSTATAPQPATAPAYVPPPTPAVGPTVEPAPPPPEPQPTSPPPSSGPPEFGFER